jgi:hypothetical protein
LKQLESPLDHCKQEHKVQPKDNTIEVETMSASNTSSPPSATTYVEEEPAKGIDANSKADAMEQTTSSVGGTGTPSASSCGDGNGVPVEDDAKGVADDLANAFETLLPGLNQEKELNFTWEHFFVTHCGILTDDALTYERNLIAHRLSPEDTLLESLSLLVELGRIPIGDKLKIVKALNRQEDSLKAAKGAEQKAAKVLGLEKYSEFEVGMIISLGGGTSKYEIEWGVEQLEDLEKVLALSILDHKTAYMAGAAVGIKARDPAVQLLRSLGYMTFDYTKGKSVDSHTPHTEAASNSPVLNDILLGNLKGGTDDRNAARLDMYS